MGTPPVAEMLASEARHDRTPGGVSSAARTPLYAFSRAIDRESLAGLDNSLKLLPTTTNEAAKHALNLCFSFVLSILIVCLNALFLIVFISF